MEKSTFEAIASNLDNRLYSGGLHFLIGITGTGKSSICEIIQKNNKSDAVFFDTQIDHSNESYQKLADDIKTTNKHVVIDGLLVCGAAGANVFDSVLDHVRTKKMGALILTQSFDDLSWEHVNVASSVSLISNLYPRENGNVYLHSVDIKNDVNEKYESLKEFWMKYWR
ncbi:DEAD/DEAH box helicase family protein [Serratia entomophila]|uniref:hypothetical protein n=1 Tax=Serratia entomophila TaxID=42906 RepID=UPI001F4BF10A|nr:hypothetical protein [Serratia entomophila]ULG10502.1 hypothetical protein 158p3_00021 [Serratia entomophila]CAI2017802.1 Uncharacterised protein [Serratia entomophila]